MKGASTEIWDYVKQRLPSKAAQVERLSALEQRLAHNTATRKRRLAYAAAYGGAHATRALRLFVSHSVVAQQSKGGAKGGQRAWVLRVEGGLIDGDRLHPDVRLSEFFDRMVITVKGAKGAPHEHQWVRAAEGPAVETDGWEVAVPLVGREATARITLYGGSQFAPSQQFKLSAELSQALGLPADGEARRLATVEAALFRLATDRGLLVPSAPHAPDEVVEVGGGAIRCDATLRKLFGVDKRDGDIVHISALQAKLAAHLEGPEPLAVIEHALTRDSSTTTHNLEVDAPSRLPAAPAASPRALEPDHVFERRAAFLTDAIHRRLKRLRALRRLAEDPAAGAEEAAAAARAEARVGQGLGEAGQLARALRRQQDVGMIWG